MWTFSPKIHHISRVATDCQTKIWRYTIPFIVTFVPIREQEKEAAFDEITQRLKQIPIFQEQPDYISKCLLSGLLILNSDIQEIPEIGTICTSNHSYRNALVYDDDVKLEIKDLNALLSKL